MSGVMLKRDCVSGVHTSCVYIPPLCAKFVDTWTQPHNFLPVYGLAVTGGLAVSKWKLDTRSHAVVIACYPVSDSCRSPGTRSRNRVTPAPRL